MTTIKIKDIRTDGGTQAREKLDAVTLQRYIALLREAQQEEAAPITVWPFKTNIEVHYDGTDYWPTDGFHRIAACKEVGIDVVEANVSQGTQRDAILQSFSANSDHGLPSSSADKRRAITRMLQDDEWSQWSDREIARRCKATHPTVAAIRAELAEVTGKFTSERTYTDRHGNQAVMNTVAIGSGNRIEIDKGRAYDWLRDYEDDKGRTWEDLEDSQVHHANSPCYQAYARAFPGQVDPKFYLKAALYRLQRQAKEETGETAEISGNNGANDDVKSLPTFPAICPMCKSDFLNFGELVVIVDRVDVEAVCYGCGRDLHWFTFYGNDEWNYAFSRHPQPDPEQRREKEEPTSPSPAIAAYARSEVRHAIAEANREAYRRFPGKSPAYFYHNWLEMEAKPQYHFMRTATAQFPADLVAEELAALCQCNPLETPVAPFSPAPFSPAAFLDRAIATEAAEIAEMFPDEEWGSLELTDSDEWYTPTWLIEKAKQVMGGIDIDPASSRAAQERVQASLWMGKDYALSSRGALGVNWVHNNGPTWQPARVWLNPPYSFPLVGQFVEKLLEQIEKGYVGEAILLVNNNTETDWWHKAAAAAAVTFTFRSRVFFWRPGREDATSPRQGQVAFYFGPNVLDFIEEFKDKGMSFMRWEISCFNEEEEE